MNRSVGFGATDDLRQPSAALPGFEHVKRYWDQTAGKYAAKILPGEFYVTTSDELVVTVLGSCVAACVRDPVFGVGGMNHFMLPASESGDWNGDPLGLATRYGNFAMEHLINEVLKHGGVRKNLELKLFGGGKVLAMATDIGARNIQFIKDYVQVEGLRVAAEDLGDIYPRKVHYYPLTGLVRMKKLRSVRNDTIVAREKAYLRNIEHEPQTGEIDLF